MNLSPAPACPSASGLKNLSATLRSKSRSSAEYTSPIPPRPRCSRMMKWPTFKPRRVDGSDGCSNASVRTRTCLITSGLEPTPSRKATRSSFGYLTAAFASSRMLRHCSSLKRSDMARPDTTLCRLLNPLRLHPLASELPMAMNCYSGTTELLSDLFSRSSLEDFEFHHGSDHRLDGLKTR